VSRRDEDSMAKTEWKGGRDSDSNSHTRPSMQQGKRKAVVRGERKPNEAGAGDWMKGWRWNRHGMSGGIKRASEEHYNEKKGDRDPKD